MYYSTGVPAFGTLIYQLILTLVHCLDKNISFAGAYINLENEKSSDAGRHYRSQKNIKGKKCNIFELVVSEKIKLCELFDLPYITKKDILSKEIPSAHLYSRNMKQDKLEKKLKYLKSRFKYYKKNDIFTIAIHIRRGDVDINFKDRYIEDKYYINLIVQFTKILKEAKKKFKIHIYSQKELKTELYENLNCTFFINTDFSESWLDMINADIFVMSKSTFSMVPAIYNSNMVIYHPFFFNPLKSWISAKDSNFESSIKKYIQNV